MPVDKKITVIPFLDSQQQIIFWGRRVGYCGTGDNCPVMFLTDARGQCGLTLDEKREVVLYVEEHVGLIKRTPTIEALFGNDYSTDDCGCIIRE